MHLQMVTLCVTNLRSSRVKKILQRSYWGCRVQGSCVRRGAKVHFISMSGEHFSCSGDLRGDLEALQDISKAAARAGAHARGC